MIFLLYFLISITLTPSHTYAKQSKVFQINRFDFFKQEVQENTHQPPQDSSDPYILESNLLPLDPRFYPTIANGHIGHQLFSNVVYLNNLFNGKQGESHKAQVPITTPKLKLRSTDSERFVLDTRNNIFTHHTFFDVNHIEQTLYTHSLYNRLLVLEVSSSSTNPTLSVDVMYDDVSNDDITFTNTTKITYNTSVCSKPECKYLLNAVASMGHTNEAEEEYSDQQNIVVLSSNLPSSSLTFSRSATKHVFFHSFGSTLDEAKFFYELGLKSVESGRLTTSHVESWSETWMKKSVDVIGSVPTDRSVKSALYYLLSSFPPLNMDKGFPFPFYGVGPGGLARGAAGKDYQGHVFWDQDFWMVPALLPIYPEIAKTVLKYRVQNLPGALTKAALLHHQGAAYPWEAAFTGADVCPAKQYIEDEIHITGDVIYLLKQYIYVTNDFNIFSEVVPTSGCKSFFSNSFASSYSCQPLSAALANDCLNVSAWDMLRETAFFWQSKAEWKADLKKFVINGVMGPDEFNYPVNNSVFTNLIASQNLEFAADVADRLGVCADLSSAWRNVSNNLVILLNESVPYHPEYEGFNNQKDVVKQADTIMLGFPLNFNMSDKVRQNDLTIYEMATTSAGPAMTWGMFAINWLVLSNEDKATPMFLRQFKNIQAPFNIWSENSNSGGAVNFLTGMGGFMQSILYGYFGLRINPHDLTLDPKLIPISDNELAQGMTMKGLRYQGVSMNVSVSPSLMNITYAANQNQESNSNTCIKVIVVSTGESHVMCDVNQSVSVNRLKVQIVLVTKRSKV